MRPRQCNSKLLVKSASAGALSSVQRSFALLAGITLPIRCSSNSVSGIRSALAGIAQISTVISDRDTAATMARHLVEHGLESVVTAFQRYAEALYGCFPPPPKKPRRNAFQNLAEGSKLWQHACGKQDSDYLSVSELNLTTLHFQQRHLLAHTQGIVDDSYIASTADTSYQTGQRIVVRDTSVIAFLDAVEKLADRMRLDVP